MVIDPKFPAHEFGGEGGVAGEYRPKSVFCQWIATAAAIVLILLVPSTPSLANPRIGVSVPTLANPFWQRYVDFLRVVARELEVDIEILDYRADDQRQIEDMDRLLRRGVDGLIITPRTTHLGPALIARAQKVGVPLVVTDRWPGIDPREYPWDGFVGFIGPDDRDAGYRIAKTLINELGRRKLIAINGVYDSSVAEGRFAGFIAALDEHPDAKLLKVYWAGETTAQGMHAAAAALAQYEGQVDGIWCYNDSLAIGVLRALSASATGRDSPIAVVGMDLIPEALGALETGDYQASYGGHWLQGGFALIMLYDYLNGYLPNLEYRVVKLKLLKVTRDNLELFRQQFIDNPPRIAARKLSKALSPESTGKYFFEITLRDR